MDYPLAMSEHSIPYASRDGERPVGSWNGRLAWALSASVHAVLMMVGALSAGRPPDRMRQEPERRVEIVMRPSVGATASEERPPSSAGLGSSTSLPADSLVIPFQFPSLERAAALVPQELALPDVSHRPTHVEGVGGARRFVAGAGGKKSPARADVEALVERERAGLESQQPRGEPVQVRLFGGKEASGRSFVFLIDRSHSMGSQTPGALAAAEQELLAGIRDLAPHHHFQVIAYHHACLYLQRRELIAGSDENKRAVVGFLSGRTTIGATEHERAILSALRHMPDVIFLLTDGGEPALSESQIRRITELAGGRTEIHCVEFGLGPRNADTGFLERLARKNRGGYSYVDISRGK